MTTDNESLLRRYPALWTAHDVDAIVRCFTPDCEYVDVVLGVRHHGHAGLREFAASVYGMMPDFTLTYSSVVATAQAGAAEWLIEGTWGGEFEGVAVAPRRVTFPGVTMFRFRDGHIGANTDYRDYAVWMRQLGVLTLRPRQGRAAPAEASGRRPGGSCMQRAEAMAMTKRNQTFTGGRTLLAAHVLAACAAWTGGAAAQEPAAQAMGLEEITVTARKREESLQETPIAITAFTADDLEERSVSSTADIGQYVPNVQFDGAASESGGGGSTQVSIRGIGQTDYVITVEPGVGLYLDGVYIGKSVGSLIDTVDLERIEVLRGPQGTLFGKNTIGGAIVLTSKRPSIDPEFSIDLTTGDYDRIDAKVVASGALSDRFRVRVSGATLNRDGHVDRVLTGDTQGDKEALSGRFVGEFDVTDEFLATVAVDASSSDEPSPGQVLIRAGTTEGFANSHAGGDYDDRWVQPIDELRNFSTGANSSETDVWGTSLTLDWNLGAFSLKSITAFRNVQAQISQDLTLNPTYVNEIGQDIDVDQVSQELQLAGVAFDDRLKYLLGFFWQNEDGSQSFPVLLESVEFTSGGSIDNDSTALFAQATYDVTERMALTVGGRYTCEQRSYLPEQQMDRVNNPGVIGLFGLFGFPPAAFAPGTPLFPRVTAEDTDGRFTPAVTLDYHFTDDILGYFAFSQGFKGGGFTMRGFPPPRCPA